jgi:FixJ family two-component response regulator
MVSIIDDDPSIREAMDGLVTSLGYGAWTFASAEDFLRSDHMNDTSCVITDVQMPGLSGVELQTLLIAQGNSRVPSFLMMLSEILACWLCLGDWR